MDIFLAGTNGRRWCIEEFMNLHLTGVFSWGSEKLIIPQNHVSLNILESFYYVDDLVVSMIPKLKNFMLDSGAFTFFSGAQNQDWDEYVERYAHFINQHDVKLFFELDIDKLVGEAKTTYLRKKLEKLTNKQCIPVWHKFRGKDNFIRICQEYPYVAIGGIVSKEITQKEYGVFPYFINTAHKYGAKIHGLGFTNLEGLTKYHFDSVDSTSWVSGNRFGSVYKFNGKTMVKYGRGEGQRMKNARELALNNFFEWAKFALYAERNL